jgi:GLUG motif-containing protein
LLSAKGRIIDFATEHESVQSTGFTATGLLVAVNYGLISRCQASGKLAFDVQSAGGLVGVNLGTIQSSYADARMGGTSMAEGGLAGYNAGKIAESFALGSVNLRNGSLSNLGGLVGENGGVVENSFARNRVKVGKKNNNSNFGGLVGLNDSGARIESSYTAGAITAGESVGGLVGFDSADAGNISMSYWDLDEGVNDPSQGAGNVPDDPGITGLTTAQFQSRLPEGLESKIWAESPKINAGFPYLLANPPK